MLAQRMIQQGSRRLASQSLGSKSSSSSTAGLFSPLSRSPAAIIASNAAVQRRHVETAKISGSEAQTTILARQRLNRPVSPHLTIYKPQVTWTLSILNRITGSILSGAFYLYGSLYLVAPLFGWQVGSAALAVAVAKWGVAAKVLVKFPLAFFFTFHSFNGVRHLVWDTGRTINNLAVVRGGWLVLGLSVVTAVGLCLY